MTQEFKFYPIKEFHWYRTMDDGTRKHIGHYIPNMSYNCTKDPVHDALREKCQDWESEGKIIIVPLKAGEFFKRLKP